MCTTRSFEFKYFRFCKFNKKERKKYLYIYHYLKFEDILKEYKVDIYISGHVHKYERIHPTYKN